MRFLHKLLIAAVALCFAAPASAQWQVTDHAIPIGNGAGVTGFNSVGPCLAGIPIVGAGISADPTCLAAPLASSIGGTGVNNGSSTITIGGNLSIAGAASLPAIVQGDLWYGSAAGIILALPKNTDATRYLSNTGSSNNPIWAQVDLTNGVTGILPAANGGYVIARQTVGDANASLSCLSEVATTATLTAARLWTLPLSSTCKAGTSILITDEAGGISLTTPIVIASSGSDTINSSQTTAIVLAAKSGSCRLTATGASPGKWTAECTPRDNIFTSRDSAAYGDNTHDDTGALQALFNICQAEVYISGGIYRTTSPLTITCNNLTVRGSAAGSRIFSTVAAGDIIQIGNGTDNIYNIHFEGITLWSSIAKAAGTCAINARKILYSSFDKVHIGSFEDYTADGQRLYNGLCLNQHQVIDLKRSFIIGLQNDAVQLYGNGLGTFGVGFYCDAMTFVSYFGHDGIVVGGDTGGVNIDCNVQLGTRHGVFISQTLVAAPNREVLINNNAALDSNGGDGFNVDTNGTTYLLCNGCWSAGNTGSGGYITATQPANARFKFTGAHLYANHAHGLRFSALNRGLSLTGSHVILNGSTSGHGVWLDGIGASGQAIVEGNTINGNGTGGVGFGVVISGTNDNFVIASNIIQNNSQGQCDNQSGFGPTKIFTRNVGCANGFTAEGVNTLAQITADQNNYSLTSTDSIPALAYISSDAARNITGLSGGWDGRILWLHNSGSFSITLKNESASSSAANRLSLDADYILDAGKSLVLKYNGTASRWQFASPAIDYTAWTSYTPTLTCGTGTLTTASATGYYKTLGKTTFVSFRAVITTNGTCATSLLASVPVTPATSDSTVTCREIAATGNAAVGWAAPAATVFTLQTVAGAYPVADGQTLACTGIMQN